MDTIKLTGGKKEFHKRQPYNNEMGTNLELGLNCVKNYIKDKYVKQVGPEPCQPEIKLAGVNQRQRVHLYSGPTSIW